MRKVIVSYPKYSALRNEKNMTDYRVAHEIGISASSLSEWKSGHYTPNVDKLYKIAQLFNVPYDALLEEVEVEA